MNIRNVWQSKIRTENVNYNQTLREENCANLLNSVHLIRQFKDYTVLKEKKPFL